jgi:hypothetical protein
VRTGKSKPNDLRFRVGDKDEDNYSDEEDIIDELNNSELSRLN